MTRFPSHLQPGMFSMILLASTIFEPSVVIRLDHLERYLMISSLEDDFLGVDGKSDIVTKRWERSVSKSKTQSWRSGKKTMNTC